MATILNNTEISAILDQRGPMNMLDRLRINPDYSGASGVKCISMGHSCFQGHFPGAPILPGVLQVGALSQAAGVLLKQEGGAAANTVPIIEEISKFKFRKPVMPGDLLRVDVKRDAENPALFHGMTYVNGETASQGRFSMGLCPASELAFSDENLEAGWPDLPGISETMAPVMNAEEIMAAIPHRFPFLLIDRVLLCDPETLRFVALKNVSATDSYFDYSNTPVLPRYLQAEMAAQAGCGMALSTPGHKDMLVYFMAIDKAIYHDHVYPGDQLLVDINISVRSRFGKAVGKLHVGPRVVADLELKFAMIERESV